MIHVATMIQATVMRSSMTGSLGDYYTCEPYKMFSVRILLAAAKLLLFQADLFVRGWLIITPRSHAWRSREEDAEPHSRPLQSSPSALRAAISCSVSH